MGKKTPQSDAKSVRPIRFITKTHAIVRLYHVRETAQADKAIWTPVNDARVEVLIGSKPENKYETNQEP